MMIPMRTVIASWMIMEWVEISFAVLDDDDAQIGSTSDAILDLAPGRIWKFSALVLEADATKVEVTSLTGN